MKSLTRDLDYGLFQVKMRSGEPKNTGGPPEGLIIFDMNLPQRSFEQPIWGAIE